MFSWMAHGIASQAWGSDDEFNNGLQLPKVWSTNFNPEELSYEAYFTVARQLPVRNALQFEPNLTYNI